MISGTIKKYENKEKHKIYVKTLAGKNHGQKRKLYYYQFERELQSAVHRVTKNIFNFFFLNSVSF